MKLILCLALAAAALSPSSLFAQNLRWDYFSGPVHYQPTDPWVRGEIFRWHTGHNGWFYNCDHEESKRFSPVIEWKRQPWVCRSRCECLCDWIDQLERVKQRVRWGSEGCYGKHDRKPPLVEQGCSQCADANLNSPYLVEKPTSAIR
ncbi:MAG TPA: hypothetical protein PKD64_05365 [Pirellulaceae bacterium]|nr:hypothetical protein [Pirellulaceae bacterium]HMO91606.1 hypothetical protein [Pirellulaceae bacterium]HMP68303.1 hypothetical protein [Pirellulaceae bacterium]